MIPSCLVASFCTLELSTQSCIVVDNTLGELLKGE